MGYYYADGNRRVGPVNKAQLMELVKNGKVTARTKVMESGSPEWEELGKMIARMRKTGAIGAAPMASAAPMPAPAAAKETAPALEEPQIKKTPCSQCGVDFVHSELMRMNNQWFCPVCKVDFVQRMKEGVVSRADMRYAGFWIRLVAFIVEIPVQLILSFVINSPWIVMAAMEDEGIMDALLNPSTGQKILGFIVWVAYWTFFPSRLGGNIGKLALKLRVVTVSGERIGYLRALFREITWFFLPGLVGGILMAVLGAGAGMAAMAGARGSAVFIMLLAPIIMLMPFVMAAFMPEKKALHDWVCGTRVIRI